MAKSQKIRYALIVLGILAFMPPLALLLQAFGETDFCGTFCPRMWFTYRQGMASVDFTDSMTRAWGGVTLLLGVPLVTLFIGRHWCSHICPVGGTQEVVSNGVPEKAKMEYRGIPAPAVRYGYMAVYLLAPAIGIGSLCCSYCNFAVVPHLWGATVSPVDRAYFMSTGGLLNLGLIALLGFFAKGGRGYCNFICPVGAIDAASNWFASKLGFGMRMRVAKTSCDGCGTCIKSCPTGAISVQGKKALINQWNCFPCRKCTVACPNKAFSYGPALPEKVAEPQPVATA